MNSVLRIVQLHLKFSTKSNSKQWKQFQMAKWENSAQEKLTRHVLSWDYLSICLILKSVLIVYHCISNKFTLSFGFVISNVLLKLPYFNTSLELKKETCPLCLHTIPIEICCFYPGVFYLNIAFFYVCVKLIKPKQNI